MLTCCPSAAGSLCSRPPWRWRCCPLVCGAPSSDASFSELLSSLMDGLEAEFSPNVLGRHLSVFLCVFFTCTSPLSSCHHLLILQLVSLSFLCGLGWQVPAGYTDI